MKYYCYCGKEKSVKRATQCISCRLKPSIKFCKGCNKRLHRAIRKWCRPCYLTILSKRDQEGSKNSQWKGGITLHSRGYVYIKNRTHPFSDKQGYIFEHRLIMEKHLGRYLNPNEIIHHINGIKNDNSLENLKVMTQSEHMVLHNGRR